MSRVKIWNTQCNNVAPSWDAPNRKEVLLNQAARLQEELNETVKAIEDGDNLELLDGLVDCQVVLDGLTFLSRLDAEAAFEEVMINNDLKRTRSSHEADAALNHYRAFIGQDYNIQYNQGWYSLHRDSDNKICKFPNHPQVDLTHYVQEV